MLRAMPGDYPTAHHCPQIHPPGTVCAPGQGLLLSNVMERQGASYFRD